MADVLILAIETSTSCGSVALTRGTGSTGKVLAEYTLQPELTHSRRLLGTVAAMMAAIGVDWSGLTAVSVSQGPGSFTGLRIGMAAAKGIAMAAGVPLVAVPSLDGLALQATPNDLPLCCLLDARKQQVYAAFYRYAGERCRRISPFLVMKPEELAQQINEPTLMIGPGIQAGRAVFASHSLVRLTPSGFFHPRAAMIGFCGGQMLLDGTGEALGEVVPLYVRASEAELSLVSAKVAVENAL